MGSNFPYASDNIVHLCFQPGKMSALRFQLRSSGLRSLVRADSEGDISDTLQQNAAIDSKSVTNRPTKCSCSL